MAKGKHTIILGLDARQFRKQLGNVNRDFKGLKKSINAAMAAFAVREITRVGVQLARLAGEAEGVQRAFGRMADPTVLRELQDATRGTVSELELMRQAVQAKNLGVPIENLANLFKFAEQRATDTGQSIQKLVSDITTGIGRKSVLVLDNLGISASELRKELGGVSLEMASVAEVAAAVERIAGRAMMNTGDEAETAGQKIARLEANFENLRVRIGNTLIPVFEKLEPILNKVVTGFEVAFSLDPFLTAAEKIIDVDKAISRVDKSIEGLSGHVLAEELKTLIGVYEDAAKSAEDLKTQAERGFDDVGSPIRGDRYTKFMTEYGQKTAILNVQLEYMRNLLKSLTEPIPEPDHVAIMREVMELMNFKPSGGTLGALMFGYIDFPEIEIPSIEEEGEEWGETIDRMAAKMQAFANAAPEMTGIIAQGFSALGNTIQGALASSESAFGRFAGVMLGFITDLLGQQLAASMANAITGATGAAAAAGPFAPAVLPATLASMIAAVLGAFASIPAFEKGGISRGGMALVGEAGPELVDLPSGARVIPNGQSMQMLNAQNFTFGGVLLGQDLAISVQRTKTAFNRQFG